MPDILHAAVRILTRRKVGVLDYARTLVLPDGDFAGMKYDPERHPAQAYVLQKIDEGASWVCITKPVQDGGSLVSFAPILRRVHALGQTAIVAYPTLDSAKDAWVKKIWPMLEKQGGTTPKTGGGSRGGAARVVNLPSGGSLILRSAGGRNESGQASATADALLVDEVDDWADMRVLRLIERRISRSRDPLAVYVSTVKRDASEGIEQSRITRLYEQGTRSRMQYPCPHCGVFFCFEWEQVDLEKRCMHCPACAKEINETQRLEMLRHASPFDAFNSGKFSMMWTALESPFSITVDAKKQPVIAGLCMEFEAARIAAERGDHGNLRQFYRDRLCRPYVQDASTDASETNKPTRERLASLAKVHGLEIVQAHSGSAHGTDSLYLTELPAWMDYLTVGIDVQEGGAKSAARFYWLALACGWHDKKLRHAIVGHGIHLLGPVGVAAGQHEIGQGLDHMRDLLAQVFAGHNIALCGVDIGNQPGDIWPWLRGRHDWFALEGHKQGGGALPKPVGVDLDHWLYERDYLKEGQKYVVATNEATRICHAELLHPLDNGGIYLPRMGTDDTLIKHLCAKVEMRPGVWSDKSKDRSRTHRDWTGRHDYLDALAYARSLSQWHRMRGGGKTKDIGNAQQYIPPPLPPIETHHHANDAWIPAGESAWI